MPDDRPKDVLAQIAQIASDLGPALAPSSHTELLRSITDAAMELFQAAACSVALLTDDQRELVFHVASGAGAEGIQGVRIPSSKGIAGWVVTSGQPLEVNDTRQDARFDPVIAEQTGYVPTSILAMPLETERQMIGVIEVLDHFDSDNDFEKLSHFARAAALAIENSRIFTDLGRALFDAVGRASTDGDVTRVLNQIAEEPRRRDDDIAELAAYFNEIAQAGPTEKRAAVAILREFAAYLKNKSRKR